MTTSTFRFDLTLPSISMATRPNGQELLEAIERILAEVEVVELDFGARSPTPSFADQCLGGFVKRHGLDAFKRRVKLLNVPEDSRPLVRHVVLTRANEALHSAHTRGLATRPRGRQNGCVDSRLLPT
jgi:hypothetical protein